ncbi:MAG: hypothetical protein BGO68_02770 [Candidatus Amoebophilus sp. 36-38]|nr:MAG: hypothetical protein BGO68_02770 [Candidatus Amoebophilus sp. 36-38]
MKNLYNPFSKYQRLIAQLLLFVLVLESCDYSSTPLHLQSKLGKHDEEKETGELYTKEVIDGLSKHLEAFIEANKNTISYEAQIASAEKRIDFYTSQIASIDPKQKIKNEEQILPLQKQLNNYNQQSRKLKEQRAEIQRKLDALTKEKEVLDTDEDICYWEQDFTTAWEKGGMECLKVNLSIKEFLLVK